MQTGVVDAVWRFPAKSMQGAPVDELALTPAGVVGDRVWAVRDEIRGGIRGAKHIAGLMQLAARFTDEPTATRPCAPIEIARPDGEKRRSDDRDVDDWLSDTLGRPVTLWPLAPAEDLDHYRRGAPDNPDLLTELRAIFGRNEDEPLPDVTPFAHVFEFETPPGTYVDAYPLLLVTAQSLTTLARLNPRSQVDVRRFRPNVVIESSESGEPFPEMEWVGRTVTIGEAVLEIVAPCPRCVMITHPFADLERDPALMRSVVRDADQNVGVYANVVTPGLIHPDDAVTLAN